MSEKQARIKRKNEPERPVEQKKKGSVLINCITAILIIAFLGLGGYALKDNIKAMLPEKPEKEKTVSDIAKDKDMSVDEFIAEYGLDGEEVTKKTTETELIEKLTVENYAKYSDMTTDELLEKYGIEGVTGDVLWKDAYGLMPMSKYAEEVYGTTFAELKEQAGFPDEITENTRLNDANEIMTKLYAEAADTAEEETEEDTAEDAAE